MGLFTSLFRMRSAPCRSLREIFDQHWPDALDYTSICFPELYADVLSRVTGNSLGDILQVVAEGLKVSSQDSIEVPDLTTVLRTGYSPAELYQTWILPQKDLANPSGYFLVAANPEKLQLDAFAARGIEVRLASGSAIEHAWQQFIGELPSQRVDSKGPLRCAILGRIVSDAIALGANEVFLGHPSSDTFECYVAPNVYQGALHPSLFDELVESLKDTRSASLPGRTLDIEFLSLALTRSFEGVVLYLGWSNRCYDPQPFQAQVETQARPQSHLVSVSLLPQSNIDDFNQSSVESVNSSGSEVHELTPPSSSGAAPILLVDDDWRFRELAQKVLSDRGYQVLVADSAKGADEILQAAHPPPCAIICDLNMPGTDGRTCVRKWKQEKFLRPIVCMTSETNPLVEEELAILGVDAFVRKDENPRILVAWIQNLIFRTNRIESDHARQLQLVKS